ncbi:MULTISPECIES: glycosyltransferase [Flavobacterium]|uniref:glycosyltransferase n=1 Tax=Flavobacterium TaxID=237 RepID=UPI001182F7B3|nr:MULTISPECIES: glycosyltransferase [Flavobacterium]MCR4029654.1 glycosyltransferase [Flavobacterium panacis]
MKNTSHTDNIKRKVLLVVNTQFPYGKSEDFLSNELEYAVGFDEIICFPILVNGPKTAQDIIYKKPKEHVTFYNSAFSYKSWQAIPKLLLQTLTDLKLYKELRLLARTGRFTLRNIKQLFLFLFIAHNTLNTLDRILKEKYKDCDITLYSYWMHISAFVIIELKKRFQNSIHIEKEITRCHRFDLYEYADAGLYLPMRRYILSNMNEVHSISKDGITYLKNWYPRYSEKLKLSRLGCLDKGVKIFPKSETLRIVSCSWMRPVKRVSAILEAVSKLSVQTEWVHYGDGEEFEMIKNKVAQLNNPLVSVTLMGAYSNEKVLEHYAVKPYDVFINVSENEGVPVSIMEAMSFGKIIIATNVGGTAEIVENDVNGFLLDKDFAIQELVDILSKIASMEARQFDEMCVNSRKIWEERCNAAANYEKFYQQLKPAI